LFAVYAGGIVVSYEFIRWLHLSDFHTGKDLAAQETLFNSILANVEERIKSRSELAPHFVFITGDIADKGKKDEYEFFNTHFLEKLKDKLRFLQNVWRATSATARSYILRV
jgi:3',5'-cyclic AMP phosphodiesterase CpdA